MKTIGLTLDAFYEVVEGLKIQRLSSEPIAGIQSAKLPCIDSSLKTPFQRPEKNSLIEDICQKAALLFCFLATNHCLENGNKRASVGAIYVLADNNGYTFEISDVKLYAMAMAVVWLADEGSQFFDIAVLKVETILLDAIKRKPGKEYTPKKKSELKKEFEKYLFSNH